MLASHALALVGVPIRRVIRLVQDQRAARYGLLRGYFHGADDDSVDELELQRLTAITLAADSACLGQVLGQLVTEQQLGVTIVSVRRAQGAVIEPDEDIVLQEGDTLLLSGRPKELNRAASMLLKG